MSHFGLQILYHVVSQRADAVLARLPPDRFGRTQKGAIRCCLESRRPIREFDLLAYATQAGYSNC